MVKSLNDGRESVEEQLRAGRPFTNRNMRRCATCPWCVEQRPAVKCSNGHQDMFECTKLYHENAPSHTFFVVKFLPDPDFHCNSSSSHTVCLRRLFLFRRVKTALKGRRHRAVAEVKALLEERSVKGAFQGWTTLCRSVLMPKGLI